MTKKYENIINRAYVSVPEELKNIVKSENSKYSTELSSTIGFGNIATFIFKALSSDQRGELMNCATNNTFMTGEAMNKRIFYLIKRICEVE